MLTVGNATHSPNSTTCPKMSKRAGETTIKTSIRIRPWSQQERETFPGPSPVQAAPGEVRLFQRPFIPAGGRARWVGLLIPESSSEDRHCNPVPRLPTRPAHPKRQETAHAGKA